MTTARAPGKIVLWGEYAVLTGAPAAVLAIDRYASCRIDRATAQREPAWQVQTRGFASPPVKLPLPELLARPDGILPQVLRALPSDRLRLLPEAASVTLDTSAFQARGTKLGVGSSAAICTAAYFACATLLGLHPEFERALAIHNAFQGKAGSGIDVAAAWHGGILRFQAGEATPCENIDTNQWAFFWTGRAAATTAHVDRFRRWVAAGPSAELGALQQASVRLFDLAPAELPSALGDYVRQLRAVDAAAGIGIYGPGHERLHALASNQEVIYKPCGAGGGDVGAAISDNPDKLEAFAAAAIELGFEQLAINRAEHGVHITR